MNIINYAKSLDGVSDDTIILTHDAVRPFVTDRMIDDSIAAMDNYAICTAAVPATDTIVVSENGQTVCDFPLRSTMYQVQTPQTFRIGDFVGVYSGLTVCKLFYRKGHEVGLIMGDQKNIKLTYPADLTAARTFFEEQEKNQ